MSSLYSYYNIGQGRFAPRNRKDSLSSKLAFALERLGFVRNGRLTIEWL